MSIRPSLSPGSSRVEGKLRVSLPSFTGGLVPILSTFMRQYPDVKFDVDFSDRFADLIGEGYDAIIRIGEPPDSRLKSKTLGSFRFEIAAAPSYLKRAGIPVNISDLRKHACLHRRSPDTGKLENWPFVGNGGIAEEIFPVTAIVNGFDPLIAMAEAGNGVICVPEFAIRRQLADGDLIALFPSALTTPQIIRALWPGNRYACPKLSIFLDFFRKEINLLDAGKAPSNQDKVPAAIGYDLSPHHCHELILKS